MQVSQALQLKRPASPTKGLVDYELLHVFPFDSTRKRMSVVVRLPVTRQVVLYCKGADSAVLSVLQHPTDQLKQFQVIAYFASNVCLLYTSPSPRDKRQSRMPSSA